MNCLGLSLDKSLHSVKRWPYLKQAWSCYAIPCMEIWFDWYPFPEVSSLVYKMLCEQLLPKQILWIWQSCKQLIQEYWTDFQKVPSLPLAKKHSWLKYLYRSKYYLSWCTAQDLWKTVLCKCTKWCFCVSITTLGTIALPYYPSICISTMLRVHTYKDTILAFFSNFHIKWYLN